MNGELWPIPLQTSWSVARNGRGLELRYEHREQKAYRRYQDYGLSLQAEPEGTGYRLTLTAAPKDGEPRLLESLRKESREDAVPALALLQAQTVPECWKTEYRAWITGLWEEERRRRGTRRIRPLNPPRPPAPGHFVPLRIPAGWTAAWNTFDWDYFRPGLLVPAEDLSALHWERDIAMFAREAADPPLYLDLEDWSNGEYEMAAFRIHLYRWREEGQETLGEWRTASPREAVDRLEECLGRFREN